MNTETRIFQEHDGDLSALNGKTVAVFGYGNQGRAQALNMRDAGAASRIIIGSEDKKATAKAAADRFTVCSFEEAAGVADVLFLLLPDEVLPEIFSGKIAPKLQQNSCLCFASGYNVAFDHISLPKEADVVMIAPRMIGVGVRESFLSGEGFFSFVCVHQDASGKAEGLLLALARAVGTLKKGAVEVSMKQEAILDLFNEQAFGPAFGRVLLSSIDVLLEKGLPPEAVLIEMYMSGEMAYTYRKMAQIGLVKQTNFHSHTSQYGAMSRGIRYLKLPLKEKFRQTYEEIESGDFAREWAKPSSKLKFKAIKYFAMRQKINRVEEAVRNRLGLPEYDLDYSPDDIEDLIKDPEIAEGLEDLFE